MMLESVVASGSMMLMLGLKIAAPLLGAFIILLVILAVLARVASEFNILFLSLPLRVGLGMVMTGMFTPFLLDFVRHYNEFFEKYLAI